MKIQTSTKYIDWFITNAPQLNLTLSELNWQQNWFPGYFDYHASVRYLNKTTEGRGFADTKEKAIEKAISEALERILLKLGNFNGVKTTNGMALHTEKELASQSAVLELIERDLFFCHYLTNAKILDITNRNSLCDIHEFVLFRNKAKTKGINVKIGLLHSCSAFNCVICLAEGINAQTPFGMVMGLGIKKDLNSAVKHSVFECAGNVASCFDATDIKTYSLQEFNAISYVKPLDHLYLAHSLEHANYLPSLFVESETWEFSDSIETFFTHMNVVNLALPDWCKDCGAYLALAQNQDLQSLYFGNTKIENINMERLRNFAKKELDFSDLHLYPHPFP